MKVLVKYKGVDYEIADVSKAMEVKKFRKLVKEETGVEEKLQNLYFGGKALQDDCDLCDYRLENGYTIILMARQILSEIPPENAKNKVKVEEPKKEEKVKEEAENDEENLSGEELKQRRRELLGEEMAAELEKEEEASQQPQEPCKKCKDNDKKKCKECGCAMCGGKTPEDRLVFCEECQYFYHFDCLPEPLETLPEDDWYCPDCKNDESEIVQAGERVKYSKARAKMPSRQKQIKRDWGRGNACAGTTKTCTSVDKNHFGPIPGIEVGMSWQFRIQVSEVGVHRPPVAGISGGASVGCQSIVLAGGYEDDEDMGNIFYYTGSGGRDLSGNKRTGGQSFDQELTRQNKAIAISCNAPFNDEEGAESTDWKKGKPIRVCRSYKFAKHSKFAPEEGVRYDGIYKVRKYWPETGKAGHKIWKFLFERDDESPAPWEEGARKYSCIRKDNEDEEDLTGRKRKVASKGGDGKEAKKLKMEEETLYDPEPELVELIKADVKNEKLWDEILQLKTRKDKWVQKVQDDFQCFACFDIIFKPITLPCNHSVCRKCWKKSLDNGHKECWHCRKPVDDDLDELLNEECFTALKKIFGPGYANRK